MPIDHYRIDAAGLTDLGDFCGAYGITTDGAVLIRPDGHVAWRHTTEAATADTLTDIVNAITARTAIAAR